MDAGAGVEAEEAAFVKQVGYPSNVYSPRVRLGQPLWWDSRSSRRPWGRLGLGVVTAYFVLNVSVLVAWPGVRGLMVVILPGVALMSAYLLWLGKKLTRHG